MRNEVEALHIELDPEGVAAATNRVVVFVAQAVGTCLRALEKDNCKQPEAWGDSFGYQFNGLELSPTERRTEFRNWILAKGFQDLARGVRDGLEEAHFFISMLRQPSPQQATPAKLQGLLDSLRRKAAAFSFPDLLNEVNAGLVEPVAFEAEFKSLQKVRNCLEHRGGIVGQKDIDPKTDVFTLNFPRLKVFYLRGDEEIELVVGEAIDTHSQDYDLGEKEVPILMRRVTRNKSYRLGEKVVIEPRDFLEITLACQLFASDVATKLPRVAGV